MSGDLARVASRIGESILAFAAANGGKEFHGDDLRRHVETETGRCAPASADRVLRDLKHKGKLSYTLVSRPKSLYRIEPGPTA